MLTVLKTSSDKFGEQREKAKALLNDFDIAGRFLTPEILIHTEDGARAELWIRTPGKEAELAFEGSLTSVSVDMGVDGEHNYRREL